MNTLRATTCPLDCPDACGVHAEVDADERLVRVRGNPAHGWSAGVLCGKTSLYGELVNSPERLLQPLVREGSSLVATTWERALARIAERITRLPGSDVLSLSYGGSMGLVQRKFPQRVMHALGATSHDGTICDAASTAGYAAVLGRCLGPDLEAVEESDLVLLWGSDVARTVQHLQPRLRRMQERGVPVVAIDIWRTDTLVDVERRGGIALVIAPGSDAQLALALTRLAFDEGFADRAFLARECSGVHEFETHVRAAHTLEATARVTGLEVHAIRALADVLARARAAFFKVGVGWTRRRNGAMGMRAVCSLAATLGHGDRVHYESFEHFGLAEDAVIRPDLRPVGATTATVSHVQLGRLLDEGAFGAAFVWCHNPAVTVPDASRFRRGFARDDLFTVVHEHFLTETARLADVVLPATMFVEHFDVYRSWGHRWMQFARPVCAPPPGPRSNVATFSAIARELGLRAECSAVDDERLCRELLDASRARFTDEEFARVLAGESCKPRARQFEGWGTPSGKIELAADFAEALTAPRVATYVPDDAGGDRERFWLIAAPSVHTHNSTFAHSPRHRAKEGAPRVHVHPSDARELGLVEGRLVRLSNTRGAVTLKVAHSDAMPRGAVRVDGLPRALDVPERVGVNALTSGAVSDLGGGNTMFSARVDLTAV